MRHSFISLVVGFIFAIGLGLSGMTDPKKVIGFLDIFGNWDASLIFVMVGAIAVHFIAYQFYIKKMKKPLLDSTWRLPTKTEITPSLVIGSFIFGVGWALGGVCPGPGITSLANFEMRSFLFVLSMLGGMTLYLVFDYRTKFNK